MNLGRLHVLPHATTVWVDDNHSCRLLVRGVAAVARLANKLPYSIQHLLDCTRPAQTCTDTYTETGIERTVGPTVVVAVVVAQH